MKGTSYQTLGVALQALRVAEDELCRPVEDVVTPCSCHFTRVALNGLLHSFLVHSHAQADPRLTTDELLSLCAQIESRFGSFDLAPFKCRDRHGAKGEDTLYCTSVNKGFECLNVTRSIRDLVLNSLQLREKDIL